MKNGYCEHSDYIQFKHDIDYHPPHQPTDCLQHKPSSTYLVNLEYAHGRLGHRHLGLYFSVCVYHTYGPDTEYIDIWPFHFHVNS